MRTRHVFVWLMLGSSLFLTGCAGGNGSGAALPTVALGDPVGPTRSATQPQVQRSSGSVVASGKVTPAEDATLVLGSAGRIVVVHVAEGDLVEEGQTLLSLDGRALEAQLDQAQAALDAAQANHRLLLAGPSDEALGQAQAALDGARAVLGALQAGPRPEQVAQAEAGLASAQSALALLKSGPTDLELEAARYVVEQAKGTLWVAQSSRDAICGSRSLAEAQCDGAEAQILVAKAGVDQAENQLAQLKKGADRETIVQAEQAVRAAEAQLALTKAPATTHDIAAAQAQVDGATAALDALKAAPRPEQLDAALAQIASAQAQVAAVLAQRDTLYLVAPFDGTITDLSAHVGQWVIPGQPIGAVVDLSALVVETTDLSELDVPRIDVGQPAMVTLEALGLGVPGQVSAIAPLADTLGGDVVYRVTVTLEEQPEGLRAGMSAEIGF